MASCQLTPPSCTTGRSLQEWSAGKWCSECALWRRMETISFSPFLASWECVSRTAVDGQEGKSERHLRRPICVRAIAPSSPMCSPNWPPIDRCSHRRHPYHWSGSLFSIVSGYTAYFLREHHFFLLTWFTWAHLGPFTCSHHYFASGRKVLYPIYCHLQPTRKD